MYEIENDKMFDNELHDSTKLKIEKHVSFYNSDIRKSYQRYPKTDNFHSNIVCGLYACREEEDYFYESYFKLNCLPEFLEKITYLNKYDRLLVLQTESSWNKNLQITNVKKL